MGSAIKSFEGVAIATVKNFAMSISNSGVQCRIVIDFHFRFLGYKLNKDKFKGDKEIDDNWDDYFEFDDFESHESFQIMADFAESINDNGLKEKLLTALNKPKPFRNFKWQIDNSGVYRQQWFDYKKKRYIQWIRGQIS